MRATTTARRAWHRASRSRRLTGAVLGALVAPVVVGTLALAPLAGAGNAGADTSLVGYNGTALAIGSQFAFNVPGVVPLPNENLIEEDVPFARMSVGSGPVIDSLAAPYYPGDIAADLGSLLETFGAPALPLNDPLLAESKYPTSPGYPAHATFDQDPSAPAGSPTVFSSTADSSSGGGDATGTVSNLALDNLAGLPTVPGIPATAGQSLVDVGNVTSTNTVTLAATSLTSVATAQVDGIDIAGLVDIAGLTSTAHAVSDGTTGTPTATLKLGNVTVDGTAAYIDGTGVHVASGATPPAGVTPAQLQQTVNATLAQDGVSIRTVDPQLTTNGAQASADAGGLVIAISHQFDVPFIPGEPTIPVPELGNVGLPAGVYTATTSITLGLAQASADASGVSGNTGNSGSGSGANIASGSSGAGPATLGLNGTSGAGFVTGNTGGFVQSLGATGPGSSAGSAPTVVPAPIAATSFPIHGIPPPLGWTVVSLLACILLAYPLLLLARWQFRGRKETSMTLDISSETVGAGRTDTADAVGAADAALPYDWAPDPVAASGGGDEGRRDDGGHDGGGGHVQKARHEGRLDLRNSWQVVAGSVLIPLGVIFILIGWYGAAHARVVQQQIPYMVSGSFIGLGCMVVGGFLFWGHWLYRIYDQAELHHEEQQQLLELIAASLMGQTPQQRSALARPEGGTASTDGDGVVPGIERPAPATSYYATATGSVYHRADCAVIAHHPEDLRVLGADGVNGLRPCQICAPTG